MTVTASRLHRLDRRRTSAFRVRLLIGLELVTGVAAVIGGVLLTIAPDGSLMAADPVALAGSPFADYRVPGLLLAIFVGGGYLLAGVWQWTGRRGARGLSFIAGAGLVVFEGAELLWLGFQPLEAVFARRRGGVRSGCTSSD